MRIGEVAEQAGVSIDAIRFYERRGVLPVSQRSPSGYRMYTSATVERIRFARALQHLGFTLDEVIDALDRGGVTCDSERWRLEVVLARIDAKIAALRAGRREVLGVLGACDRGACVFDPERRRPQAAVQPPTRTTRSAVPSRAAGAPAARTARVRGRRVGS
jgi:DNA-binding transcriptional MerR regulator